MDLYLDIVHGIFLTIYLALYVACVLKFSLTSNLVFSIWHSVCLVSSLTFYLHTICLNM